MGTTKSRPRPPPPKKRRKKKQARIYDYFPPPNRLRQTSGPMYHSIEVLTSTRQAPHSARSVHSFEEEYEDTSSRVIENEPLPRWRSKWEVDMRPDPKKEAEQLRTWLSMPLPDMRKASAMDESVTSKKKPKHKDKKRTARKNKRAVSPLSDSDEKENEAFERKSVKSTKVDSFQMLHKTCDRSENTFIQTARLWNLNTRRTSKFLSQDWNLKDIQMQETVPVLKQSKRVINVVPANAE